MSLTRSESRAIAGRYVSAMISLAMEKGKQDQVGADLMALKLAIESSLDLRRVIHNPMITLEEKANAFDAILQALKADAMSKEQVRFVVMNKRAETLGDIAAIYQEKLVAARGELSAEIISARPMSDAQVKTIAAQLKKAAGRDVNISARVDASLIGGFMIKMGSRMLDHSIAGKLQRLKATLKAA